MASYSIEVTRSAQKDIRKLPKHIIGALDKIMRGLAKNPRPNGCKKLRGTSDHYRLRYGNYRVVYEIIDKKLVIIVVNISHRKDVYRKY